MKISMQRLEEVSAASGFRPDVTEKVIQLIALISALNRHPFLKGKIALKGGTALNLFIFDLPRLSVDIDLNYIGHADRESFIKERPGIEKAMQAHATVESVECSQAFWYLVISDYRKLKSSVDPAFGNIRAALALIRVTMKSKMKTFGAAKERADSDIDR